MTGTAKPFPMAFFLLVSCDFGEAIPREAQDSGFSAV